LEDDLIIKLGIARGKMEKGGSAAVAEIGEACIRLEKLASDAQEHFLAHLIRLVMMETERLSEGGSLSVPHPWNN
jgi:hypothetical protein